MKLLNIITLLGIFFISSCKKSTTDLCSGTNTLTAFLDFEKDIQCVTTPCYLLTVTLSTGETIQFDNLNEFNIEEVDQTIEFVGAPNGTKPLPVPYHIECIKSKIKKFANSCENVEKVHLKPLEITCQATNCPKFICIKDGIEILIPNLNDFNLEILEQDILVGFDANIINTNPPQYTAKCVESVKTTIVENPIDPLPCDMALIGTMKNENGQGGCGWMIHLSNGEWVHALNMYGFAGLQVEGATVSVALDYNVDAPTECNKAKPVFILCGRVITTP